MYVFYLWFVYVFYLWFVYVFYVYILECLPVYANLWFVVSTGEAMEQGLRDCCRSIRIGKILIQSDEETQKAKVYYAKFPPDIYRRKVLLMYPILSEYGYCCLLDIGTGFYSYT